MLAFHEREKEFGVRGQGVGGTEMAGQGDGVAVGRKVCHFSDGVE